MVFEGDSLKGYRIDVKNDKVVKIDLPNVEERKALEQQPSDDWYDVPSDEMTLEQARQSVKDLRKKLLEQQPSEDCVIREQAIVQLSIDLSEIELPRIKDSLDKLPPVTPTHETCKDCKHNKNGVCPNYRHFVENTFYCADFEKRGNENG